MVLSWGLCKTASSSKIYRKDFWININFWFGDHNAELSKKLKDSSGKPDDCTMVNKRTERIGKYAYHFYGFWKITGLNLCFLDLRKPSPQTNYDNSNLVKWYWVNKWKHLPFFTIWPLQRLETLRVPVTLSDKLGRLSH